MPPSSRRGEDAVLDDADRDGGAVALAGRLQFREVGAVCQDFHRLQREGGGRAPQDARPGGEEVAGHLPGQELPVGEDDHPRPEASLFQQVTGQFLLGGAVAAERGPEQAPGPGLRRHDPPDLRECPVAGLVRGAAEELVVGLAVRHVRRGPVHGDDPQPAAEHPRRVIVPGRARDLQEYVPQRCRAEFPAAPRHRGDVRLPPPAALAGIDPAVRVELAFQQVSGPPLVIKAVGELDHDLPVAAVPAPEQPQRQREVHHQPRRQQPAPLLPRPGRLHRRVHQLRRENPGQNANRDPVRQPAIRRKPLRTIMRHEPQQYRIRP